MASSAGSRDPIALLQQRIERGEVVLARDSVSGYLPALLRALDIPVSSQGLVFSRTSLQTDRIAPWSPRAIYFSDDVYIGYVAESQFLEIASIDPDSGARFYTFTQEQTGSPRFQREGRTCLMCHQGRAVAGGVPGLMVLSTVADRNGYPITAAHDGQTMDATPVRQRFGGWYVTGTHGRTGHSGNVYSDLLAHEVSDKAQYRGKIDLTTASARTNVSDKFDTIPYPSAHSDIVALMVLVHQATVHNLIATLQEVATTAGPMADAAPTAVTRVTSAVENLVRALVFAREAPLEGTMRGTTTFAQDFARIGPRDPRGRSLRDFDLERRLFRYPLSYLVYSPSFDALPEDARRMVYRRLHSIFDGNDPNPELRHLGEADRVAVREILAATKPEFTSMSLAPPAK